MKRISTLAAMAAITGLSACAQTPDAQISDASSAVQTAQASKSLQAPTETSAETKADDPSMTDKDSSAISENDMTGDYWLKYGMSGLYGRGGSWRHILRDAGPHKVYEIEGDLARISADQDHWVRRIDLSVDEPVMRPSLKIGAPDRPVTRFPNILEREIKKRGIEGP